MKETKKVSQPKQPETQVELKQSKPETKRNYRGDLELDHDLFKLEVSKMQKNMSWDDHNPNFQAIEHCHFFHTIDKKGRPNDTSSPTGNHFHEVEYWADENGNLKAKCGPAKQKIRVNVSNIPGRPKYETKVSTIAHDDHTHDMKYIRSERIKAKKLSAEEIATFAQMDRA